MPANQPEHTRGRKLTNLTVDEMLRIATAFEKSAAFTVPKPGGGSRALVNTELFVIILAGQELGLGPSQSVMGIKMIKGKPEFSANLMASMVRTSGRYDFRTEFGTDEDQWCAVTFFDVTTGSEIGTSRFTKDDAIKADLWKGNYLKFWRNMLFARALSNGVKWFIPDALMVSAYHEGEQDGDTEASVPELPQQPAQTSIGPSATITSPVSNTTSAAGPEEAISPDEVTVEPDREPAVVAAGTQDAYSRNDDPEIGMDDVPEPGDEDNPLDFDPVTEPPPPVVAPPTVAESGNVRTISAAQIGLAHVRARAAQLSKDRYNDIVEEVTGVRHTDKIPAQPRELFDNLLKRLDAEALLVDRPDAVQPDPDPEEAPDAEDHA